MTPDEEKRRARALVKTLGHARNDAERESIIVLAFVDVRADERAICIADHGEKALLYIERETARIRSEVALGGDLERVLRRAEVRAACDQDMRLTRDDTPALRSVAGRERTPR